MGKEIVIKMITAMILLFCLTGCGQETAKDSADILPAEEKEDPVEQNGGSETAENIEEASPVYEIHTRSGNVDWALWSEGIYCYSDDGLCGYLKEEGGSVTPCIYEEATPFSEGLACVRQNGKYGYIGKDGETVLPFVYDQASPFREGAAYFSQGEQYGLIDREGNVVLELTDCDSISSFREGLAYFSVDGQYGYMDKNGKVAVEPVYDDAGYFHNGLAVVIKDGLGGVIGKDGREILPTEYIGVRTMDTCIVAQKEDRLYFFDANGEEISSSPGNQIYQKNDILYISIDNKTGFADKNGNVILEPVYKEIRPIPERELVMVRNEEEEYGILDYRGQVAVPFCYYDRVYDFVNGRAAVERNGKYGVLRYDGTLEMPIEYDKIKLFSDGSMAVWTEDTAELTDSGGNLILTGEYSDLSEEENGYTTWAPGRKGKFWDKQGNLISQYEYELLSSAYGVKNTYIVSSGGLLRKGEEEEELLEEVLLTNQITPRIGAFREFLEDGGIRNPFAGPDIVSMEEMRQWKRCGRLYRMGEEGSTVLYFFAEPFDSFGFGEANSGLFIVKDGKAEALIEVGESGGSMGGDKACLWYDTKEGGLKPGTVWRMGGFGGAANGAVVYELKQGDNVLENAFDCCYQSVRNYDEETLLENAELFYDEEDHPFTRENILEAGSVVEYTVNDKQVTSEDYYAVNDRYICYWPADMN